MRANSHSCVVVAESRLGPLGVITERDLVGLLAKSYADGRVDDGIASDMMSSPPITIDHRATLFESLVLCRSRGIRHLPVSNARGRLVGLVTQSDLMQAHLRMIEAQSESVERAVRDRTEHLSAAIDSLKALSLEDPLLEIGNVRPSRSTSSTRTRRACGTGCITRWPCSTSTTFSATTKSTDALAATAR